MSKSPAGQPAGFNPRHRPIAGTSRLCDADAARRPRSPLGPPPGKTVPGKPCHLPCSKTTHLPPLPTGLASLALTHWWTAAARPPPPRRGKPMPCVAGFGLSFGLHFLPHRAALLLA